MTDEPELITRSPSSDEKTTAATERRTRQPSEAVSIDVPAAPTATARAAEHSKPLPPLPKSGNAAVGELAIEIEGEDLDGKAFKLSDYGGKVVMLSFWRHG